jgi:undecaprenyl-diphosphatase
MHPFLAFVLGVIEGITEYLPVSSTGHLVLAEHLFGLKDDAAGSFAIAIQLGAILAVVVHYRTLLARSAGGVLRREPESLRLAGALLIGFVPTAIAGLVLRKTIKAHLFGPIPVAAALVVGGAIMIVVERMRKSRGVSGEEGLAHVTWKRALAIGVGQCFSMWPGASRSMCTIVAGQLTGLSTATAAEFSFLLGLPTLGAATLYEMYKARHELFRDGAGGSLAIGLVTSFFVAWAVIALFLRYLKRRGLEPFGYYRIVLGAVVLWMALH